MYKEAPILLPGGGIAPGKHHIHPAYVVTSAIRIFFAVIAALFFGFISSILPLMQLIIESGSIGLIILGAVGLLLLLVALTSGISYLYYRRFFWEITESDLHIYAGIIFKKQIHVPFQRVQSIDFHAGLIDRALGLVKLKVETAGGAANKGVVIPALKLAQAEALRVEVFARKRSLAQARAMQAAATTAPSSVPQGSQSAHFPPPPPQTL
ncbi:MAG: PH domain-containing protein, partial [Coriobacteriales bacterium]|nr:PH domain-containing protein [Coriobacteriales bacterium]